MSDEKGREVWWCKTHESRFLEKQPSKYALCLLSLHERNFQAIGWEDCDPVLVRVVPVPGGMNRWFLIPHRRTVRALTWVEWLGRRWRVRWSDEMREHLRRMFEEGE